jgi:hypothetical protein
VSQLDANDHKLTRLQREALLPDRVARARLAEQEREEIERFEERRPR